MKRYWTQILRTNHLNSTYPSTLLVYFFLIIHLFYSTSPHRPPPITLMHLFTEPRLMSSTEVKTYWKKKRLKDKWSYDDFKDNLKYFKIFGHAETWDTHKRFILKTEKVARHGRAMAGLSVYIETSFTKYVKRICEDCTFGLFFSADKLLFNSKKPVILAFVYFTANRIRVL